MSEAIYKIRTNYYIEASAGTGKTYNIIEYVKKLISEDIPLNKILIVTYTEKAVEELKNRVRKEIKGVDVNDSEIYTIHSFCQKAIREYCVSCEKPINLDVIDDEEVESFVDRYIRDIIFDELVDQNGNVNINIKTLKKYFVSTIKKYYLNKNWQIDSNIVSIKTGVLDFLKAKTFDDLAITQPDFYDMVERLKSDDASNGAKEYYQLLINHLNPLDEDFLPNYNKTALKNAWEKDILEEIRKMRTAYANRAYEILTCNHIEDLYNKWIEEKEKHQKQSFNDMIRYVREEVVSGGPLLKQLKEKYEYGVIDEFQDTNAIQWDIFKNIFLDQEHYLVVVGDPKQSIYSFQGADVLVYEKAISDMKAIHSESKELVENYRSSEKIINATNELFKIKGFFDKFSGSKYPNYENENGKKEASFNGKNDYKAIWITDNNGNLEDYQFARVVASKIVECSELVDGKTRLQIASGNGGFRNVTFKDFTILSRTRTEVAAIKRELKRVGIPFIGYKDTSLFSGRECIHWAALFDAINAVDFTGKNRKIFKRALFTNFFGKTLEEISDEKYDRDDTREIEMIKRWKIIANSRRYEDLIDSIIVESNIEERMSSLNDIQSLSIYKQIGDFAIEYLSDNHSLGELARKLENLNNNTDSDDDKDINLVSRSTNFDSVQLMTIHASKGLEFPVVIFASNLKGPNYFDDEKAFLRHDKNKPVIVFNRDDEYNKESADEWHRLFYVAFTRARYLLMIPNFNKVSKDHYDFFNSILNEYIEEKTDYYELIDYSKLKYDSESLKKKVKTILSSNRKDDDFSKESQDEVLKELINDKKNKLSFKHSYSSLSHGGIELKEDETTIDDSTNKEGDAIIQDLSDFDKRGTQIIGLYDDSVNPINLPDDYPKGASIGTALHEMFELVDYSSYSDEDLDKVIRNAFNKEGIKLNEEWITASIEIFKRVTSAHLPVIKGSKQDSESFKLSSITLDNKKAEAEFNFNLFNDKLKNYANGFIDLLFRRGEYYSIVDWKSDVLNDYDFFSYASPNDLACHTSNRYSIQRVLYAYTLIMWLHSYYPNKTLEEVYNEHFGGVYYVYLRGCSNGTQNGIYAHTWSSWDELKASYDEIITSKVRRH